MKTTLERITQILIDQLGERLEAAEIRPESELVADLGADSLDLIEIAMSVEEEFGIVIDDEDSEKWEKVGDIVAYVDGHK